MNSGEFHSHVTKLAKRCQFPNAQTEERVIRDAIFAGMKSLKARDKATNLMNEEGKVLTLDFLMNQLEIEDSNCHHKSLSQLDSTASVNFVPYDHRQNKRGKNKKNVQNGKQQAQKKSGEQGSSNSGHHPRKPPEMEGKCMRCGKQDHQLGQRCPAKNAKCKECHKIGHFHKVCQSKKRATQRAHLMQAPEDDDDTHIDENGVRQPNPPPKVNMPKVVNHIDANRGKFNEGKHLNLPFRGEKYLNTFIVTDANDCPNLLSHGSTFRMGILLSNYPKDMVVEGENVPHFNKMSGDKMRAPSGLSNVFQILGDIWK